MLLFWYACGWLIVAFLCSAVAAAVVPQPSPCRTRRVRWWTSMSPVSGKSCPNFLVCFSQKKNFLICFCIDWCLCCCGCWAVFSFCSCSSATNRVITAKDHASVQINIGHWIRMVCTIAASARLPSGFDRAQVIILVNCSLISLPNSTKRCCFHMQNLIVSVHRLLVLHCGCLPTRFPYSGFA